MIDFAASLLTWALRRAISDPAKRAAVIERARAIVKEVEALLDNVQPVK